MEILEGLAMFSEANSLFLKLQDKYEKTLEKMSEPDRQAFLTRLKVMANRTVMYKYDKIPYDIKIYYKHDVTNQ